MERVLIRYLVQYLMSVIGGVIGMEVIVPVITGERYLLDGWMMVTIICSGIVSTFIFGVGR